MRSEQEICQMIERLEADARYKAKPASVETNVVLALSQTEIRANISALRWVLQDQG